jgi:hypothetical protein
VESRPASRGGDEERWTADRFPGRLPGKWRGRPHRLGWAFAALLALTLAAAPAYGAPFAYVTSADTADNDTVSQYNIGLHGGRLAPLSPPTVAAEDRPTWR